jgi:hypothetical protein
MGEILIYASVAVIAGWIGWHLRGVALLIKLSRDPRATIELLEQLKEINDEEEATGPIKGKNANWIEVKAEQVGQMVYAYAKDTNQFLGQGASIEEAVKSAQARYPAKVFWWDEPKQNSQTA